MRVHNEECFVLRTIPVLESSLVVDVLTRNHGRLSLIAKGVRRLKSRFRGAVRPFQLSLVSWTGKNELPTMTSLIHKSTPNPINGRRVYCSYYLNELIIRFVRQSSPNSQLFVVYREALERLNRSESEFHTLRVFEKNMLKVLGYELFLQTEADGITPIRADRLYHFDFESGPIPATHPTANSVAGHVLLALDKEKFDSTTRLECQLLLKRAIEHHCEGKTDLSREIFKQTIEICR